MTKRDCSPNRVQLAQSVAAGDGHRWARSTLSCGVGVVVDNVYPLAVHAAVVRDLSQELGELLRGAIANRTKYRC